MKRKKELQQFLYPVAMTGNPRVLGYKWGTYHIDNWKNSEYDFNGEMYLFIKITDFFFKSLPWLVSLLIWLDILHDRRLKLERSKSHQSPSSNLLTET